MRINQNISALNAYRNMVNTENRLNKSLERLSSGLRINRAADDAAGLAISEKMRGQIRGLNQAMRNAQDGISLIQTAEGALNETHSILQRMRELSVQAANDTLTQSDRQEIQKEINQLSDEIDRIANTTEFNTKKLLDGTTSALSSTDNLKTKVFMRDGLRVIDQFGQKSVEEGNYKLEIEAQTFGKGQVLKTDIMKIKHHDDEEQIGQVATGGIALRDIDLFWDASGNFLIEDPQTITIVQGNGESASFTIFGSDTLTNLAEKLNKAIDGDEGLNQGSLASGVGDQHYVNYVTTAAGSGHHTVEGTFVIQSAVVGKEGELSFVGSEALINALSLSEIQESEEATFQVTITNAHQPANTTSVSTVTGNMLIGELHQNVDIKFDPMANIAVGTGGVGGDFEWASGAAVYTTFVHLADNSMVFHIGANPLQDVDAAIGDMRAEALGVDNILVTDRGMANRSITQIDRAIDRVSAERSKMGALQNRLDHTINNLGVAAENLTAAESRIRDLDFAQEMIEFTRNQIMQQAGTSMLAQANMKPQSVLMLLG